MPGETLDAALAAAGQLERIHLSCVLTHLGENVSDRSEAAQVADDYHLVLERIRSSRLSVEISVKLTHLGLDVASDLALTHVIELAAQAAPAVVWIDMESSKYVDPTLDCYRRAHARQPNVGVCLQSYLYRTQQDLDALLPLTPAIRLVKGAYNEPATLAYPHKRDVDENFFKLAVELIDSRTTGTRAAIATHDIALIRRVQDYALTHGVERSSFEFQMLYGIQRNEQMRLAAEGWPTRILISYGEYWFPWFMRRLAERPANIWFVARNLFG
jgi:proline dehydrogenase